MEILGLGLVLTYLPPCSRTVGAHKMLTTTHATQEGLAKDPSVRKPLDNVPKLQGEGRKLKPKNQGVDAGGTVVLKANALLAIGNDGTVTNE